MTMASDLIRQGLQDDVWQRYCGFLDLSLEEFMHIQQRLLLEQMHLFAGCELGRKIIGETVPASVQEFRNLVPLTEYEDYEPFLSDQRVDVLPGKPYTWARTSGRSGQFKWVPYTQQAYVKMGERILAALILCAANRRGELRLKGGDVLLYNTPARPYSSGVALMSLADLFQFQFVPPLDQTEDMTFQERMEKSFQTALVTGIDIIGSITSVLVKIGERFSQGPGGGGLKLSRDYLHPRVILRFVVALARSKLQHRALLPKDLWRIKGAMVGGTDTALYKDKIFDYWGVVPHENYSSTETMGTAAVQAWDKKGLYFFPDSVFLEFIPEVEWMRSREDPAYEPGTVLLTEVEPGPRYEMVITSFDGGPFLRYRMHDLVRFVSLRDEDSEIDLPSMVFAGRSDGLIDLAGFTGVMDESGIWTAIHESGMPYVDWVVRKEEIKEGSLLHLYVEPAGEWNVATFREAVHENLKRLNRFYADLESMLGARPLRVTLLAPGTFRAYAMEMQATGADLAHMKPTHMNPSNRVLGDLLRLSHVEAVSQEVM
jgi:hypothetical protein